MDEKTLETAINRLRDAHAIGRELDSIVELGTRNTVTLRIRTDNSAASGDRQKTSKQASVRSDQECLVKTEPRGRASTAKAPMPTARFERAR